MNSTAQDAEDSSAPAIPAIPLAFTDQNDTPGFQEGLISPELAQWIRFRAEKLKLRLDDRKWAAELVNHLRDSLLEFLKKSDDQPYFQLARVLNSGSYYEMVKIHNANEFDIMLTFPPPSRLNWTELGQYQGLFYQVSLCRPTHSPIRSFLLEDGLTISASKFISEMYLLVRRFIRTYKVSDNSCHWVVNRKRVNSPAVTLSLLEVGNGKQELLSVDVVPALEVSSKQGWPQAARAGPDVDHWLGKKAKRALISQNCFFVPKRPPGRNLDDIAKEGWRISFSHIEKQIISSHGNKKTCCESAATKCCRKQCLKLLKCLIEGLKQRYTKELDALCSYHGKTAFLHTLSTRAEDSLWARRQLPVCFMHLLGALEGHARSGLLPHFFIPNANLFAQPTFPRKALVFLTNALEEQRTHGLPLLMPPAPAPPMEICSPYETQPLQYPDLQKTSPVENVSNKMLFFVAVAVVVFVCLVACWKHMAN
ncbi:hypothetical protein UPYG_G00340080 [Umbra pygmaea]|uniref:Cyclic GMP-AMP synthase n=1 Tax=Umbra pygmaea TaxID=75934 RepID=A0ABD0WIM2_UMBPY